MQVRVFAGLLVVLLSCQVVESFSMVKSIATVPHLRTKSSYSSTSLKQATVVTTSVEQADEHTAFTRYRALLCCIALDWLVF